MKQILTFLLASGLSATTLAETYIRVPVDESITSIKKIMTDALRDEELSRSESHLVALMDTCGQLLKIESFKRESFRGYEFNTLVISEVNGTKRWIGLCVDDSMSDPRDLHFAVIDDDEIDPLLQSLYYMRDSLLETTPSATTQAIFTTRDRLKIGVHCKANRKKWNIYMQKAHRPAESLNEEHLAKIISALEETKEMMK